MKPAIRFSDPVDCGERTIVPIIRDITRVSDQWGMVARDPVGLVIMENKEAWFISLAEGITQSVIDELLDTGE
ncbi:MAG: hypothetical protein MUF37_05775 [Methanoregulaceae archaeon]|jgi:hypothetical protein|nr:hypothetical protein [Methanoregulaceae archaeon]